VILNEQCLDFSVDTYDLLLIQPDKFTKIPLFNLTEHVDLKDYLSNDLIYRSDRSKRLIIEKFIEQAKARMKWYAKSYAISTCYFGLHEILIRETCREILVP
jgi:hypothetical protein